MPEPPYRLANLPGTPHTAQEEGENCLKRRLLTMNWYALKVYYNRTAPLVAELTAASVEHCAPTDVIASLLFVRCDEQFVAAFAANHWQHVWLYRRSDNRSPAPIPDREMDVFRFVVTAGRQGLELLGDDRPEYHEGDRVTVAINSNRGLQAVFIAYIAPTLLFLTTFLVTLCVLHLSDGWVALITLAVIGLYALFLYHRRQHLQQRFTMSITPNQPLAS